VVSTRTTPPQHIGDSDRVMHGRIHLTGDESSSCWKVATRQLRGSWHYERASRKQEHPAERGPPTKDHVARSSFTGRPAPQWACFRLVHLRALSRSRRRRR